MKKLLAAFLLVTLVVSCSVPGNFYPQQANEISEKQNNNLVMLRPNGSDTYQWSIKFSDGQGNPLKNTKVEFKVIPLLPLSGWREVNEVAKRYGSESGKLRDFVAKGRIRLLGSVSPLIASTDENGQVSTVYRASHIGGNEEGPAQEKIIVQAGENTQEIVINTGYQGLVPIPLVEGGLRISGASGRHVTPQRAEYLKKLGEKIKEAGWAQPLTITAGNLRWGGLYPPHFTHREGESLDIRPMSVDGNATYCNPDGSFAPNYDREKTLELIKILKESGATELYFNDPEGFKYGASPLAGHSNHLHVSWQKDKANYLKTFY